MAKLATKGIVLQRISTPVAQRVKLSGPTAAMGPMEITDLDSTVEQRGVTLVNPGTVGGTLWFDPNGATHTTFNSDMLAGTSIAWVLLFPDTFTTHAHYDFTGFVTKFEPTGMEAKGYLQAEFEITCDGGTFTYTPGSTP